LLTSPAAALVESRWQYVWAFGGRDVSMSSRHIQELDQGERAVSNKVVKGRLCEVDHVGSRHGGDGSEATSQSRPLTTLLETARSPWSSSLHPGSVLPSLLLTSPALQGVLVPVLARVVCGDLTLTHRALRKPTHIATAGLRSSMRAKGRLSAALGFLTDLVSISRAKGFECACQGEGGRLT
jgi:hypothetical protein